MKIVDLVKKLDRMVTKGHIMEAFEEYFAEEVITHSTAGDKSDGKAQKRAFLQGFFGNMEATDDIKLHDCVIDSDKSYSAYTFKFRNKQNELLVWNEIIRRTWKDGQVIDEYYFEGDIDELKKEIKVREKSDAEPERKTPAKIAEPIKKAPQAEKKVVATASIKQNLRLVEGIGPKIEKLLNAEGIKTFEGLAAAKQSTLKAILKAAGPRFTMHTPETWPKQAKLLAQGKKVALQKLQDELKGGRKV